MPCGEAASSGPCQMVWLSMGVQAEGRSRPTTLLRRTERSTTFGRQVFRILASATHLPCLVDTLHNLHGGHVGHQQCFEVYETAFVSEATQSEHGRSVA